MFVRTPFALIASMIVALSMGTEQQQGVEDDAQINILKEYQEMLPDKEFSKMLRIYSNNSMSPLEKEKKVVDFFSALPHKLKSRLPVPIPFRLLTDGAQQKIKSIYYESSIAFEEKLNRIKQLIEDMYESEQNFKKVNGDAESEYVEFNVNVTLKLNGFYRKEDLMNHLNKDDVRKLDEILDDSSTTHDEKSSQIGKLLRRIFRDQLNKSGDWPSLVGLESLPLYARRAVARTLFSDDSSADMQALLDFYQRLSQYATRNNNNINKTSRHLRTRRHLRRGDSIRLSKKDEEELVFQDRPKIYTDYEN